MRSSPLCKVLKKEDSTTKEVNVNTSFEMNGAECNHPEAWPVVGRIYLKSQVPVNRNLIEGIITKPKQKCKEKHDK